MLLQYLRNFAVGGERPGRMAEQIARATSANEAIIHGSIEFHHRSKPAREQGTPRVKPLLALRAPIGVSSWSIAKGTFAKPIASVAN